MTEPTEIPLSSTSFPYVLCLLISGSFLVLYYSNELTALIAMHYTASVIPHTNVSFKDIIGREKVKRTIMEYIDIIENRHLYPQVEMTQGIVFDGKPGTGKTMMARAIASEMKGAKFIHLDVSSLRGGLLARVIRYTTYFYSPCVIFIDEIDKFKYNDAILEFFDGFSTDKSQQKFLIIGCTNDYDNMSPALKRAGRLDKMIDFNEISGEDRVGIFNHYLALYETNITQEEITSIYDQFQFATPADIKSICADAFILSKMVHDESNSIINSDFLIQAIQGHQFSGKDVKPIVKSKLIATYKSGQTLLSYLLKTSFRRSLIQMSDSDNSHRLTLGTDVITRSEMINVILIRLGGLVTEDLILGDRSSYGKDDFSNADMQIKTLYIKGMVKWTSSDVEGMAVSFLNDEIYPFIEEVLTKYKDLLEKLIEEVMASPEDLTDEHIRKIIPGELIDSVFYKYP